MDGTVPPPEPRGSAQVCLDEALTAGVALPDSQPCLRGKRFEARERLAG